MARPKGSKNKVTEELTEESVVEVHHVTEDEQLFVRRKELLTIRDFMVTNKIYDIGKLDVDLGGVNARLHALGHVELSGV